MQSGTVDRVKGRIKEAAGVLMNDTKLKQEGQADQLIGNAKDTVRSLMRRAEDFAKSHPSGVAGSPIQPFLKPARRNPVTT